MNAAPRFALPALLLVAALVSAEEAPVYRWTDASGQENFAQVPPATGRYEILRGGRTTPATAGDGTAAAPGAAGTDQRSREREFIEQAEARRKAEAEQKEKARAAKAESQVRCAQARERAAFLEERTARRLATVAEDGNMARMPEDEFIQRLDDAKKAVAENCR